MTFDPEVKVGQVRVFADLPEPVVAAIVADKGLSGFRIVPVSPYRVPANECELIVGERVFQLWNACTMARRLVERSWVTDTLSEPEVVRLRDGAATARLAKLGDYERRCLLVGGDCRSWTERLPQQEKKRWWRYGTWSVAASVVIGLGVSWLVLHEEPTRQPKPRVMTVRMERANVVEPLEAMPLELAADDGVCADVEKKLKVEVAVDLPKAAAPEMAPEVRKLAVAPRMAEPGRMRAVQEAKAKSRLGKSDAVVAAKKSAGTREAEVRRTFAWLKTTQRADGSWGERPLKDTALAVLALMAHGETVSSPNYGQTLMKGVQYLSAAKLKGQSRQDIQIAACALCGASFAVPNPNVRTAAEAALKSIGDNRSVEAGRDWRGLLVDLTMPVKPVRSHDFRVAADRPDDDDVANACIFVLSLLKP